MNTAIASLLIVGFSERFHMGAMLNQASQTMDISCNFADARPAYDGNWLLQRVNWRLRDRRPTRMEAFNTHLIELCRTAKPDLLLVTGMLPPDKVTLKILKAMGIKCVNYLTDDPWNPHHKSRWFMEALALYDFVFTPRHANVSDLERIGCRTFYLPFGYDPGLHFPEPPPQNTEQFRCDVLFYGGADSDRLPYIYALIDVGLDIHLYGGYWNSNLKTKPYSKGMADARTLRRAVSGAKLTLCLVRRANRDDHVMRTFEAPAMGACMLVEDTPEHREIFGEGETAVAYFTTPKDLVDKARDLLAKPEKRAALAQKAHILIASSQNTYKNRLETIVAVIEDEAR